MPLCTEVYRKQTHYLLPYSKSHRELTNDESSFEILVDPSTTKHAIIIGMFVLRPLNTQCFLDLHDPLTSIHDSACDWVYNVKFQGIEGGGTISDGNIFDAYRLALQYGLSDAVMVSSKTASIEGVGPHGYCWQCWNPSSWPHVASHFSGNLLDAIMDTRREWQAAGYLSSRQHPAQIIISSSGLRAQNSFDFLDARVFQERHSCTSKPYECFILTSASGAEQIKTRAVMSNGWTQENIESALLVCSRTDTPDVIDYSAVPSLLFERLGMKIVNHDGGMHVLNDFASAGALTQLNLSLGLKKSMLETSKVAALPEALKGGDSNIFEFFFGDSNRRRSLPRSLQVNSLTADDENSLVVAVIDTRGGAVLHNSELK